MRYIALIGLLLMALTANAQVVGPRSFTNSNVIYVDENGVDDDGSNPAFKGIVGRADRPFKSLTNAVPRLTNGMTLKIGPGTFPVTVLQSNATVLPVLAPISLTNMGNVTIEGSGPQTKIIPVHPADASGHVIYLQTTTNITLRNFTIQETNRDPALSANDYHGMVVTYGWTEGLLCEGLRLINGSQHGIGHLQHGKSNYWATIRNCYFEGLGCTNHASPSLNYDGAAIAIGGQHIRIHDNVFVKNLRDIELESGSFATPAISNVMCYNNLHIGTLERAYMISPSSTAGASQIRIFNNTVQDMTNRVQGEYTARYGLLAGGPIWDLFIENNKFYRIDGTHVAASAEVIAITSGSGYVVNNVQITGNYIDGFNNYGINFGDVTGATALLPTNVLMSGNVFVGAGYQKDGTAGGYGIAIQANADTMVIANNVFYQNGNDAILIKSNAVNVTLIGNVQYKGTTLGGVKPFYGLYVDPYVTNLCQMNNLWDGAYANWLDNSAANGRPGIFIGTGVPAVANGVSNAIPVGSIFLRSDGGAGTAFYVSEALGAWTGK